ncbi:HU family DNA-binding protein [Microvirga aerilata]
MTSVRSILSSLYSKDDIKQLQSFIGSRRMRGLSAFVRQSLIGLRAAAVQRAWSVSHLQGLISGSIQGQPGENCRIYPRLLCGNLILPSLNLGQKRYSDFAVYEFTVQKKEFLMAKTATKVSSKKAPAKKAAAPKAAAKASAKTAKAPAKAATKAAATKAAAKAPAKKVASKAPAKKAVSKASAGGAASVLTLRNIAERLSETHELPKRQANEMLTQVVEMIAKSLKKGEKIRLTGLGILQVRKRAARMGRNPQTGEPVKIKASKKIAFRAAKDLKESV